VSVAVAFGTTYDVAPVAAPATRTVAAPPVIAPVAIAPAAVMPTAAPAVPEHRCNSADFERPLCSVCNGLHWYCSICGRQQDECRAAVADSP
jgi:hypothetical protein